MKKLHMILPLALILCFMVSCQDKEAMAELEEMKAQTEVEEQNMEIVRQFFESIDNGTHNERTDLFTSDYACHFAGFPEPFSLEAQNQFISLAYKAVPDNIHIIKELFAKGDKVAMRVINQGTHQGEWEGIPPTGNKYAYEAMWIFRLVDGKIAEAWGVEDQLSFMQQLGMELKPREVEK